MTALPPILRAWQLVDRVSPWTMHAEAAALLFRADSVPQRLLSAIARIDYSGRMALGYATSHLVGQWPQVESTFVVRSIPKFGRLLLSASMPDANREVQAWDFGGHLVVRYCGDGFDHRCLTPTEDLIRAAVELVTAELTTSRLYIDRDGLTADSSDYGEHVTEQTRELIADLQAELATGETCRTVLLVGPPGSGKSTMARQVAAAFADVVVAVDGVSLAADGFKSNAGACEQPEHVAHIVRHCGAQAVVVDDYDRQTDEGTSLAFIRDLRASARVVIFTANNRAAFSGAEARPKRFDKIVHVAGLDRATARSIAPDLPEIVREQAWSTLLAAYLHELAVLCRAGRVDPAKALAELQERQRAAEGDAP